MPSLIINNTVQVRLVWAQNGTPIAVNVVHGIKQAPLSGVAQADADALFAAVKTNIQAIGATSRGVFSNTWTLSQLGIRDLDTANNVEFLGAGGAATLGTSAVEYLPLNVASCVTLRTGKAGGSYRGRFFVSGWTEGASVAGLMSSDAQVAAKAVVDAVKSGLNSSGYTLAVASRKLGKSEPVTTVLVRDSRWDTQRRRIVPGI